MKTIWQKCVGHFDEQLGRYVVDHDQSVFYVIDDDAPVALCKGDDTARATEYMAQQNMAMQMQFSKQLMGVFEKQFAKQSEVLDYLKGKMQPMIENPTGYSKEALAAMRTSTTDALTTQFQNARSALRQQQLTEGGADALPSGVNQQITASMLASEAGAKATAQNNITLADENLKQQNYWNAINTLNGTAAMFAPQSYAGEATNAGNAATNAGNSVANLSQAYKASQSSGLMGALGGLAGGVFGAAGSAGGFGKLFSCYVAAAVFGEEFETGLKTALVREWLWTKWRYEHRYAPAVLWLYSKTGRWVAKQPILVRLLTPLFELALRKAMEE